MDNVIKWAGVVGLVVALLSAAMLLLLLLVGAAVGRRQRQLARPAAPAVPDTEVRPFVRVLAEFLARPGHPHRVVYNPTIPCLQVAFRSPHFPVVAIYLEEATALPTGASAVDPRADFGKREPEVFTKAERRLLADLIPGYLTPTANPTHADRILFAARDDVLAGPIQADDDGDAADGSAVGEGP